MSRSVFDGVTPPRRRTDLLEDGVTAGRLRGPGWQRTSHGFYVPAGVDRRGPLQRVAQASRRLPAGGAVGGWAAARTLGVRAFDGLATDGRTPIDVPLCIGAEHQIRSVPGIRVWADSLPSDDVVEVDGVPVTTPERTCLDGMRRASGPVEAVVFADLMFHAGLVTVERMRDYVGRHRGWRGHSSGPAGAAARRPPVPQCLGDPNPDGVDSRRGPPEPHVQPAGAPSIAGP
ncbi:MAG: hypothetical protein GEU93_14505 [Propionibacteriales bacterium]|nr:hypothetical protein [Propionibacteriales bacterium]